MGGIQLLGFSGSLDTLDDGLVTGLHNVIGSVGIELSAWGDVDSEDFTILLLDIEAVGSHGDDGTSCNSSSDTLTTASSSTINVSSFSSFTSNLTISVVDVVSIDG